MNNEIQAMRLISWNVNGRVKGLSDQSKALRLQQPDVLALQEVSPKTAELWHEKLREDGLNSIDSFACQPASFEKTKRRQYGTLLASRWPLNPLLPTRCPVVPWPERILSGNVESPWGDVEIHSVGIPPGCSNGWIKVEMFEGIYACLNRQTDHLRILCGDFNSPQAELAEGRIVTWGQDITRNNQFWPPWRDSRGVVDTGARWDVAERNVLEGLRQFDLSDVFRTLNGYGTQESSWYWKGKNRRIGRRFDHVFASQRLHAVRCQYLHDLLENGLSDHSAIEVDFEPSK